MFQPVRRPRAATAVGTTSASNVERERLAVVLGVAVPTDHPLIGRRSWPAHACRDSEVVCGRVELTVRADARLGLTGRERHLFAVRFLDGLESRLHAQLTELVHRRRAVARRAAERMEPIEIVFDDPLRGLQRITGRVQPPQRRNRDLLDVQFGLRELPS
jgi:hypothetical protein